MNILPLFLLMILACPSPAGIRVIRRGISGGTPATPLYYGDGCNGTTTNTCTVLGTTQGLGNYIIVVKVTMGANGAGYTLNKIAGYVSNSDGANAHNMQVGIYADSGGNPSGLPLCHSPSVSIAAGATAAWVQGTPASCPTLSASTAYWVGTSYDSNSLYYYRGTGATGDTTGRFTTTTFGTWTDIPDNYLSAVISTYALVTPN